MASKALLVGLNRYPDPANNLRGCINDVLQMSELLRRGFGFDDVRQIRMLTDERATTAAIKDRLRWLLDSAGAGDVLVFHYSGHGAQVRDRHGDELDDGLDEIICPYDLDWDDPFTDDDLYECLKGVPAGTNLTVVLDCCHAGTGLRDSATPGRLRTRYKCLAAPLDIRHRTGLLVNTSGTGRGPATLPTPAALPLRQFGRKAAEAGATLLAACRADQLSADAWIAGDFHGAFTYFLCAAAESARFRISYGDLIERTRQSLNAHRFDQVPQLEGPRAIGGQSIFAPLARPSAAA